MRIPGEYVGVSRTFYREWPNLYKLLMELHATPINRYQAEALVYQLVPSVTRLTFRGYRGRWTTGNRITLPARPGVRWDGIPYLRVGIVLHECAHALSDHRHGIKFCQALAALVKQYTIMKQQAA